MTTRNEVYDALDSERAYQDSKWYEGTTTSGGKHSLEEWFTYIADYVQEAQHVMSREAKQNADPKALDAMRKVGAMCVAAMEQLGAPQRPGFGPAAPRFSRTPSEGVILPVRTYRKLLDGQANYAAMKTAFVAAADAKATAKKLDAAVSERDSTIFSLREQLKEARNQISRLASFILAEVPGEPSTSEGAVDTAIRLIRNLKWKLDPGIVKLLTAERDDARQLASMRGRQAEQDHKRFIAEREEHQRTREQVERLLDERQR